MNDYINPQAWWNDGEDRPRGRRRGGHHPRGPQPVGMFGPGFGPFGPGGPFGAGGPMGSGVRGRRGHVRSSILTLLCEAPMNGYQIMQTLSDRTEGAWKPSPGAVYPALSQLEDEGLIEAISQDGRKSFRITEAGQEAAAKVETKPWEMVNEAVAGLTPDRIRSLWREYAALAGAAKEIGRNGTSAQIEAATALFAETRRRLYGILADTEPDADLANTDDLR